MLTRDATVIHVDTASHKLSFLVVKNAGELPLKDSLRASIELGLPIQGIVQYKDKNLDIKNKFFSWGNLTNTLVLPYFDTRKNFNEADYVKFFVKGGTTPRENIRVAESKSIQDNTDSVGDSVLSDLFKDDLVINKKTSVEVINASSVDGLGGRVADMLKRGGYNVVSVVSGSARRSQIIYRIPRGDEVETIIKTFQFSSKFKNETGIADITVILGSEVGWRLK